MSAHVKGSRVCCTVAEPCETHKDAKPGDAHWCYYRAESKKWRDRCLLSEAELGNRRFVVENVRRERDLLRSHKMLVTTEKVADALDYALGPFAEEEKT